MGLRGKILIGLGASLIAWGLTGDWPVESDPTLPETRSFFLFLGGVVGSAGLLIAIRGGGDT
ncbi:hypothetical protein [Candidatus Nitrospira inopinata]|jgi:hypothetical protein|uniref:Uncharacterized protein n=1 Tax=Candidatus Nitrospira inopinata TaxID=1715989 RepID=A0A0S4KVA5_9BACT|nr:hypothetical protein [Candidatus Nitrospira inopinata]CUQ67727.1 exported protein of unknown function [Candidatus Nitrospira inopinata]